MTLSNDIRKASKRVAAAAPRAPWTPTWRFGLAAAAALGGLAYYNSRWARAVEARNPPIGKWIEVDGVRLHYFEKGEGPALTLIHGNLATGEDFSVSGLVERLAARFRVIVFDRPGYGYSARPGRLWTPAAYAALLHDALKALGVARATVVGHSFGSLVATEMALKYPEAVTKLVVIGGYFYPSARLDVPLLSSPAIPLLGDLMRYTISPLLIRLLQPALFRMLFAPAEVTERWKRDFPKGLAARPLQIRAQAEDAAVMVPAVAQMQARYSELKMPVTILAGAGDLFVGPQGQSGRFHEALPQSELKLLAGAGHMAHHVAVQEIAAALEEGMELPAKKEHLAPERVSAVERLRETPAPADAAGMRP